MMWAVSAVAILLLPSVAFAEVTSTTATVQTEVTEFIGAVEHRAETDSQFFPNSEITLPLQLLSQLSIDTVGAEAAGAVAAQFADPETNASGNPEEFAINLSLGSIASDVSYTGRARVIERRQIVFAPGELGLGTGEGSVQQVTGRLFIDGALAMIAVNSGTDMTGAYVRLSVTITRSGLDLEPNEPTSGSLKAVEQTGDIPAPSVTVFSGQIELTGTADGGVELTATGDFPRGRLLLSDLSFVSPEFESLRAAIIPNVQLDFPYSATVGQTLTLSANIVVEAANLPDNTAVAAIIGTPTDSLTQVIGLTLGAATAKDVVTALDTERANPTGELAFPEDAAPQTLFGFCGLFGFELYAIGFALLLAKYSRRSFV